MNGHNMSSFFSAFGLSMSDCVDMLNSHKSSWKEGISFSLSFDWQANTYIIILIILHTVGTIVHVKFMSELFSLLQVIVKNLSSGTRVVLKSHYGYEVLHPLIR